MNLWTKILQNSGLPECRSIAEHLCNIGGSDTILRVVGDYDVVYIGEETVPIIYIQQVYKVSYVGEEIINVTYIEEKEYKVLYLGEEIIKIKYKC